MLTCDALIEQAKIRGLPATKLRGILREYLQILIMKEIYQSALGKKLYFTGGTYLRLLHNIRRFSEDLDFNSTRITKPQFERLSAIVATELNRKGIQSKIKFTHWKNIYAANLSFPDIEKLYNIVSEYSKNEGIVIKLETINLTRKIKTETQVLSGFGEIYPCICTDRSILFADKIDAVIKKNRGRHIYDLIFMFANNYHIDKQSLKYLGIKGNPFTILSERINKFSKKELQKQAETLRPFLFDEKEADLIANARDIIPQIIEKYKRQLD